MVKKIQSHSGEILSVAVTSDNKYVVSGGRDNILRIYDTRTNEEIKSFTGHRDAITSLSFKGDSYSLFSGSLDRCVKNWDLKEMGYMETLFGHQDGINALDCYIENRPISGGSDHTLRSWRIQEESHLVFRGHKAIVDCVSILTSDCYLSGDEEGRVCLWKAAQKRPVAEIIGAHGICNISQKSNLLIPNTIHTNNDVSSTYNNNWISSISAIKMSDVFATGSCDGFIRLWSVNGIQPSNTNNKVTNKQDIIRCINSIPVEGFINGLIVTPTLLVAACGREHRLGRWWCLPGNKNKVYITRLPHIDEKKEEIDSEDSLSSGYSEEEEDEEEGVDE